MTNFNGPIPGQSLTREPGGSPWEQPPLYSDNNKVIAYYMKQLNKGNKMSDLLDILDRGMPLDGLVESVMTMGQMNGIHTVDSSLLVAPVIHQYIKEMAESADVNLVEWAGPDAATQKAMKDKQRTVSYLEQKLAGSPTGQQPVTELTETEKPVASAAAKGLIKRRT
jgi:hypothetical protein